LPPVPPLPPPPISSLLTPSASPCPHFFFPFSFISQVSLSPYRSDLQPLPFFSLFVRRPTNLFRPCVTLDHPRLRTLSVRAGSGPFLRLLRPVPHTSPLFSEKRARIGVRSFRSCSAHSGTPPVYFLSPYLSLRRILPSIRPQLPCLKSSPRAGTLLMLDLSHSQ